MHINYIRHFSCRNHGYRELLSFEKMVCEALNIDLPQFVAETEGAESFFAIRPTRKEIPDDLHLTVADVLSALK